MDEPARPPLASPPVAPPACTPARAGATGAGAAVLLYAAAVVVALQFSTPYLVDNDSYYHARFAHLLPSIGITKSFPWTQASLWRDHFADKEFLFHAFLAPFCAGATEAGVILGAKAAAALAAAAVFAAFYASARRLGLAYAALWTLVLLSAGNHFLFRLLEVRAHLFSILLVVASVPCIVGERRGWLFALGFLYSWTYAAPHFLPCLVLVHAAARWLGGAPCPLGAVAAAAGGALAGMTLHPYTPDLFRLWYVQNVVVLGEAWGIGAATHVRTGEELYPGTTLSLVTASGGALLAWLGGIAALAFGRRPPAPRTASLFALAAAAFVLYLLSSKFIEYFAPLAVLFGASAVEDQAAAWAADGPARARRVVAVAAGTLLLALVHVRAVAGTAQAVRAYPGPALAGVACWSRAHLPADASVMNLNWNDFPVLFFHDPGHHYLCALDPNFQWAVDPAGAEVLEQVRRGEAPFVPRALRERFGTAYGVLNKGPGYAYQRRLVQRLREEGRGARVLYEDDGGAVFEVME